MRRLIFCLLILHFRLLFAEPIQLIVWGMGVSPTDKGLEAAMAEFRKLRPDIEVQLLGMGAGGANSQKLMTAIVGRVPPDVIYQDRFSLPDWASRGAFQSLDDLIERDRVLDPDCPIPQQYYASAWEEGMYGGKVYGIPIGFDVRALYWNRGLFRKNASKLRAAGLDPERPPRTWSEMLEYNRVLTIRDKNGVLMRAGFMPFFGGDTLYPYLFQNAAAILSKDGRNCEIANADSVQAIEYLAENYKILGGYEEARRYQGSFRAEQNDPFMGEDVAMKIDGDWYLYGIAKYRPEMDFAVSPPPIPDQRFLREGRFAEIENAPATVGGGFAYAIPVGAKHREAAWSFIKFMTRVQTRILEVQAQWNYELKRGRTLIPSLKAQIEANQIQLAKFIAPDPKFAKAQRELVSLLPFAQVRPITFAGQLLNNEIATATESALMGRASPIDALNRAQTIVQRELDAHFQQEKFTVIDSRVPFLLSASVGLLAVAGLLIVYRRAKLGLIERQEARWAYCFVAPAIVGFLCLTVGPMVSSLYYSFTRYNVLTEARWVGTANYADLASLHGDRVAKGFANVAYLGLIGVPIGIMVGLAVALLVNHKVKGIRWYRTMFYLPAVLPSVASAILWMWILNPSPEKGMINSAWNSTILPWINVPAPGWLQSEAWSKPSLILMSLWGAGGGMMLWLAALNGIPKQLYEAAEIDGATAWRRLLSITIPQLTPFIFFSTVMGFIGVIQLFDPVYVMNQAQGGVGPGDSLLTPAYQLFVDGFHYFRMGTASALAWIIFVVVLGVTAIQFLLARKWVFYESEKS